MKPRKTPKRSVLQAAQKAVQQTAIDPKERINDCQHKNWNFDLESNCPDCGMEADSMVRVPPLYKSDKE